MLPKADALRAPSLRRHVFSAPTLISFGLAILFLLFLAARFDIDLAATWREVGRSNPLLYLLGVLSYYSTFLFRGIRWRKLLENAGVGQEAPLPSTWGAARLILAGWFANSVTWFRLGDAYRAYAYTEESGARLAPTAGTVLAERIIDMALVFVLLVLAFALVYVEGEFRPPPALPLIALAMTLATAVGLGSMLLFRVKLAQRLPGPLRRMYEGFHQGAMGSFRRLPAVGFWGLLAWLAEAGRLYCVVQATGESVGISLVLFVSLANALLTTVPLTPGGLGIVEPGIVGLLMLALPRSDAVTVALLDRSISYLSVIVVGAILVSAHQWLRFRAARRAGAHQPAAHGDGSGRE